MKIICKLIILLILAFNLSLYSLDLDSNLSKNFYGIGGSFLYTSHSADFRSFPGVPTCCPSYQNGNNNGNLLKLIYQRELNPNMRIGINLGYSNFGSPLKRTENVVLAGNIDGVIEHRVESYLSDVGIEPTINYNLFNQLWLNFGFRVSYITQSSFSQIEQIIQPNNGLFNNGLSVRNEINNETINNINSLLYSLNLGVNYQLPLNHKNTLLAVPELKYTNILNELVTDLDWSISNLSIGLNILWRPQKSIEIIKEKREILNIDTISLETDKLITEIKIGKEITLEKVELIDNIELTQIDISRTDTLFVFKAKPIVEIEKTNPKLEVKTKAFGVNSNGIEFPLVTVTVEEFNSTLMTPLLNYIFFDEGKSEMPRRYKLLNRGDFTNFSVDSINKGDVLGTYHNILNIIGKRLKDNPSSDLKIIGCNSDIGIEENNLDLSKQRAQNVFDYFVNNLGIDSFRLKLEYRNLPAKAANKNTKDGQEENRRVELISNDFSIIAPIITNESTIVTNPETIRFKNIIDSEIGIKNWGLSVYQNTQLLKEYLGGSNYLEQIDWELNKEKLTHPKTDENLRFRLYASDGEQDEFNEDSIEVKQVTIKTKKINKIDDKEINKFNLILFDVRSSVITENNKQILNIIQDYVKTDSQISITGYTDRLGDETYNNKLAEDRATSTLKELKNVNLKQIEYKGNSTLYNPDLPEGRLYNRTVEIIIETLIK